MVLLVFLCSAELMILLNVMLENSIIGANDLGDVMLNNVLRFVYVRFVIFSFMGHYFHG